MRSRSPCRRPAPQRNARIFDSALRCPATYASPPAPATSWCPPEGEGRSRVAHENLIESPFAAGGVANVGDFSAVGGEDAGFGWRGRGIGKAGREAASRGIGDIGDADAAVHDVGDPPAVGTPGEGRGDVPWIARYLLRLAAVRRDAPQLHHASIIAPSGRRFSRRRANCGASAAGLAGRGGGGWP